MYKFFLKRFFDFFLSLCALIVLSPLLIILIVTGTIIMKGNPIFIQKRPGKIDKSDGKEKIFKIIKFRTMSNREDEEGNLLPDDVRLSSYGKFLRSTSLDELPELINILFGDMSIVGPRPQLVRDMVFMTDEQRKRHTVCQGLTGLAQINGRNNISWEDKFKWDLKYIEDITFFGDFKIILMTIWKVVKKSDTIREGTVSDLDFGDWLLREGKINQKEYEKGRVKAEALMRMD